MMCPRDIVTVSTTASTSNIHLFIFLVAISTAYASAKHFVSLQFIHLAECRQNSKWGISPRPVSRPLPIQDSTDRAAVETANVFIWSIYIHFPTDMLGPRVDINASTYPESKEAQATSIFSYL
jgi:hypothetical protein